MPVPVCGSVNVIFDDHVRAMVVGYFLPNRDCETEGIAMMMLRLSWMCLTLIVAVLSASSAVTFEQMISREHPNFNAYMAAITVGGDGMIYTLSSRNQGPPVLVRMSFDGTTKTVGTVAHGANGVAVNAEGIIGITKAAWGGAFFLLRPDFSTLATFTDFPGSGWDSPTSVTAGASGDFYVVDANRNRIVRYRPDGRLVQAYTIPREPEGGDGTIMSVLVCEKTQALYPITRAGLRCVGFDGTVRWRYNAIKYSEGGWGGLTGGADVDDEGTLYVIDDYGDTVKKLAPDGTALGEIKLDMGAYRPIPFRTAYFQRLILHNNMFVLRRRDDIELCQVYDAVTGERKQVITIDRETLRVTFPSRVWTAGEDIPFSIDFDSAERAVRPQWRVWARPMESLEYREFSFTDGRLTIPEDCSGLFVIKVTPEIAPWQHSPLASEYMARGWVEIRAPGTRGTATVCTQENRVYFSQGEVIPFAIFLRMREGAPVPLVIRLQDSNGTVVAEEQRVPVAGENALSFTISSSLTHRLAPGKYQLLVRSEGISGVPQSLVIGPALQPRAFHNVLYGDYSYWYPTPTLWESADLIAGHAEKLQRLGFNLVTNRIGWPGSNTFNWASTAEMQAIGEEMKTIDGGVAPDKSRLATPYLQTLAVQGAYGIDEMGILLYNDAGLPLGTGFDNRTPEQMDTDLLDATKRVLTYPAFRGWSWSSNWWLYNHRGEAAAGEDAESRRAYREAYQRARDTGAWAQVLEDANNFRLNLAVEAQERFARVLRTVAPQMKTAVGLPYRNIDAYPPVSFSNVDEVDLQAQFEQIPYPLYNLHNPEFHKRPGKRAWDHPETTCDAGTGDQILSMNFQSLMRGADGVGTATGPVSWSFVSFPADPRITQFGMPSAYRALAQVTRPYGPWISTLAKHDMIAIPVSKRTLGLDIYGTTTGAHYANLLEAYLSCLYARVPASLVFTEDMALGTLTQFKAVLLVDQWVEPEPELAAALRAAGAEGVPLFYDGQCRPEFAPGGKPLGFSFDRLRHERGAAEDYAHSLFPRICKDNAGKIAGIMAALTPPLAIVDHADVLLSEQVSEEGRYLFALNMATPDVEPGVLWRMTLYSASRVPAMSTLRLPQNHPYIYDVFAGRRVTQEDGAIVADLRYLPLRVFAILPAAVDRVELRGPAAVNAGDDFAYRVFVHDERGTAIKASIPVRIRLLAAHEEVLYEMHGSAGSQGLAGQLTASLNSDGPIMLEATELLTGITSRLSITVTPPEAPVAMQFVGEDALPAAAQAVGTATAAKFTAAESAFGPHIRAVSLSADGNTAYLNGMNWENNLYLLNTADGTVRRQARVGQYFTFAPQAISGGVAVQGYDFTSPEGYHLYVLNTEGEAERRFALYGLPQRLPFRFIPNLFSDAGKGPSNSFAAPRGGEWIAASGNLGLAVWSRNGTLLWSEDWWKTTRRHARLLALDAQTLLVADGAAIAAFDAANGHEKWRATLADDGVHILQICASTDGRTVTVLTDRHGGTVSVVRDGKLLADFPAQGGHNVAISPDGAAFVATIIQQSSSGMLCYYSINDGLRWTLPGDGSLHDPVFSQDSQRIAVGSDLGTLYVMDAAGTVLLARDCHALPVAGWMPDGELVVATWMGTVFRLTTDFTERWRNVLRADPAAAQGPLLTENRVPTTRMTDYLNAEAEPLSLQTSLLGKDIAYIRVKTGGYAPVIERGNFSDVLQDGQADLPAEPWLNWHAISYLPESSPVNYLEIVTHDAWLRVDAVTLVEDPAHPESWLRDVALEYWDPVKEQWIFAQQLLSDSAIHSHKLVKPVEASRFRLVLPYAIAGNLRLGELALHGENLGKGHADARAKRPVAVLFDDQDVLSEWLGAQFLKLDAQGPFSGQSFLRIEANAKVDGPHAALASHGIPDWNFTISPDPQPGEYRYLQFAWKSLGTDAKGLCVTLYPAQFYAGEYTPRDDWHSQRISEQVPREWQVVRVDLAQAGVRGVKSLNFLANGGPFGIDQILLGRTEADLDAYRVRL